MQILLRAKFDDTDKVIVKLVMIILMLCYVIQVGIRRLLNDYTYLACFPLHEGRYDKVDSSGKLLDRRVSKLE